MPNRITIDTPQEDYGKEKNIKYPCKRYLISLHAGGVFLSRFLTKKS